MNNEIDNFLNSLLPEPCNIHNVVNCLDCEQESLQLEYYNFLQCCGSCLNFVSFIAESGFCKISESNCICKNPKSMIDIWDDKCDKWIVNPNKL